MNKPYIISTLLAGTGISLIIISLIIIGVTDKTSFIEYKSSNNKILTDSLNYKANSNIKEISFEAENNKRVIVAEGLQGNIYSGETREEVANKLNRHLGNDLLANKGDLIAEYSMSLGVDPYLATAIMMHESACQNKCSALAQKCFNFSGQKGSPTCSGSYKGYSSVDEGIKGHINNLYKNYFSKGLVTVDTIAPKYAESKAWPAKIKYYMNKIEK